MGCISVRYEEQIIISHIAWVDWFVLNKNVFELHWQLIVKVQINKL